MNDTIESSTGWWHPCFHFLILLEYLLIPERSVRMHGMNAIMLPTLGSFHEVVHQMV